MQISDKKNEFYKSFNNNIINKLKIHNIFIDKIDNDVIELYYQINNVCSKIRHSIKCHPACPQCNDFCDLNYDPRLLYPRFVCEVCNYDSCDH
jgi:hypothetical protein